MRSGYFPRYPYHQTENSRHRLTVIIPGRNVRRKRQATARFRSNILALRFNNSPYDVSHRLLKTIQDHVTFLISYSVRIPISELISRMCNPIRYTRGVIPHKLRVSTLRKRFRISTVGSAQGSKVNWIHT